MSKVKAPERVYLDALRIEESGMREESLRKAREERRLCTEVRPVRIDYWPEEPHGVLSDGRHRVKAALADSASELPAIVTVYGPRGGVRARRKRAKLLLRRKKHIL